MQRIEQKSDERREEIITEIRSKAWGTIKQNKIICLLTWIGRFIEALYLIKNKSNNNN